MLEKSRVVHEEKVQYSQGPMSETILTVYLQV